MIKTITDFLAKQLKEDLPYKDIENEDIDEILKGFIRQQQTNPAKSPRICAVMIALFEADGEVYIPCILRPQKSRFHPGQIAFPGGGREEQDKDLNETAIRETIEEIGVTVPENQIIGDLTDMYVPPSNSLITPKVAFLENRLIYNIDPNEVDKVIEIPISDLLNLENHVTKPVTVQKGITVQMPVIKTGEHLVWGATARIMKELALVLREMN